MISATERKAVRRYHEALTPYNNRSFGNLGGRYETKICDKTTIFRLNAANLTNRSYWINFNYVGAPRTIITLSAQVKF